MSVSSCLSGRAWSPSAGEEGAYLSAQIMPREERSAAELRRDARDVLHAHNSRSENLTRVLAASRAAAESARCNALGN